MHTMSAREEIPSPMRKYSIPNPGVSGLLAPPTMNGINSLSSTQNSGLKFGTRIPNRVFIGGIPPMTSEVDLTGFFSKFGNVRQAKVIVDKSGMPKGYGFITFETEDEANAVLKEVEIEGGSLPFKDRRLNVGEAVRKVPPMMPYESNDTGHRQHSLPHQTNRPTVMPGMFPSPVDPNMPLLSQFPGAGMSEVMAAAAAAGVGLPCSTAPNGHPVMYNYFYPHPTPPMTPGYSVDVGMSQGYGNGNQTGTHAGGGNWPQASDQYSWSHAHQALPPMSAHRPLPYGSMMYPHHGTHGILAYTPPPSDMSSWSSGGSCASSTCSTASLGASGDASDPASMMPFYACGPDGNGMYYVPYGTGLPPTSSMAATLCSSQASPIEPGNYGVEDPEEERLEGDKSDARQDSRADLPGNAMNVVLPSGSSSTTAGKSLSAKIRDRRKAQQVQGKTGIDPNNNCQRNGDGGEERAKETPVISVSKILDENRDSRSPSPSLAARDLGGKRMTPPAMLPTSAAPAAYLQHYQYCPPPATAGMPTQGPSYQYPQSVLYHPAHSHAQQPLMYQRSSPQPNLAFPVPAQQPQPQPQRRPAAWHQDLNSRQRSDSQSAAQQVVPCAKPLPRVNCGPPAKTSEEPKNSVESHEVITMVENLSVS